MACMKWEGALAKPNGTTKNWVNPLSVPMAVIGTDAGSTLI